MHEVKEFIGRVDFQVVLICLIFAAFFFSSAVGYLIFAALILGSYFIFRFFWILIAVAWLKLASIIVPPMHAIFSFFFYFCFLGIFKVIGYRILRKRFQLNSSAGGLVSRSSEFTDFDEEF